MKLQEIESIKKELKHVDSLMVLQHISEPCVELEIRTIHDALLNAYGPAKAQDYLFDLLSKQRELLVNEIYKRETIAKLKI